MYSKWNFKRAPFETFVFMDLEATGLPPSRPKITEISLLAVSRHSLENIEFTNSFRPVPCFPRVVDKLCLCIHPEKEFTSAAKTLTGLNNEILLKNRKQSFNSYILDGISAFLSRQCPPVCFVSHNGYHYDFPLLKAELSEYRLLCLDDVYCSDTLTAMRSLDSADNRFQQFACRYTPSCKKGNYGLRDLYFKFFKEYPNDSHSAEGDTIALIRVFQWRARDLMKWMDLNAKQFVDIKPMYKDIVQEERGSVFSSKTFIDSSQVKSRFGPQANEDMLISDGCDYYCGTERRNYNKRSSKTRVYNNDHCFSSSSECLDRKDFLELDNTDFKANWLLIVYIVMFLFALCVFPNGSQG
ncbi:three prime repair exonuclease 2-like [Pleurodeles waltl]|uniref:three prime repair exonuclease 2-like n=1 Tax=Pleurodeles waltl TaxID=8319 RepID=UPI0037093BFC